MSIRLKREYLQELVSAKNRWSRRLTDGERELGFLGWHERGYLPHCDFPDLVQFVTFRLEDSMPSSHRGEWEHLLKIEDARDRRIQLEEYLDRGVGKCRLRETEIAQLTEHSLLHFHNQRYELLAWCIMPNHVHVLIHVWKTPLGKVIRSWKQFVETALRTDLTTRRAGRPALQSFWQREYWDTFMRNEDQEKKAIKYIEGNPVKARLCRATDDWVFSSVKHRDDFRRLNIYRGDGNE
jgi:putative transposase